MAWVGPKGQPVDTNDYRLVSSSLPPGPVTRNPIPGVRVGCAGRIVLGQFTESTVFLWNYKLKSL